MICTQSTEETEKYMYNYFKCVLENKTHSPTELIEYASKYIKAYEFKNGSELPSFTNEISGD
jgi:hypothetical protein